MMLRAVMDELVRLNLTTNIFHLHIFKEEH